MLSLLLFNIVLEVLASAIRKKKEKERNKRHTDWEEELKVSSFAGDIIVFIENPKEST